MKTLNLPAIDLRLRDQQGKTEIFDIIRKKFVALTAEEWVRQHFVHYLVSHKKVPSSVIAVEASLKYNRLHKRSDIVVYNNLGKPSLIVECKAPEIKLDQDVFHQVAMYNMSLKVPFLVVTNGLQHYACYIDQEKRSCTFLKEVPGYEMLNAGIFQPL